MKRQVQKLVLLFVVLLANLGFAGCVKQEQHVNIISKLDMKVGEERTISITASNVDLSNAVWTSSNESIAKVIGDGNTATIVALAAGQCTVEVSVEGLKAECSVTVTENPDDQIPSEISVMQGETTELKRGVLIDATVLSDNDFVVSSKIEEEGLLHVNGDHVGKTAIHITTKENNDITISVEVKAHYNTYVEPPFEVGASKSTVITEMTNLGYTRSSVYSNDTMYVYLYYSTSTMMMVSFDQQGKVKYVSVAFTDEDIIEELPLFLSERYELNSLYTTLFSNDTYIDAYDWMDETKIVILSPFENGTLKGTAVTYRSGFGSSSEVAAMQQQLQKVFAK